MFYAYKLTQIFHRIPRRIVTRSINAMFKKRILPVLKSLGFRDDKRAYQGYLAGRYQYVLIRMENSLVEKLDFDIDYKWYLFDKVQIRLHLFSVYPPPLDDEALENTLSSVSPTLHLQEYDLPRNKSLYRLHLFLTKKGFEKNVVKLGDRLEADMLNISGTIRKCLDYKSPDTYSPDGKILFRN